MSEATFKTPGGGEPERYILEIAKGAQPTEGDALYAAQRQRTRILERTTRGIDVDGMPFAPYSTKGPYYYYPNGRIGQTKAGAKANKAAVTRLLNRIGVIESNTGKEINGVRTRNGQGIKFEDYAAFKASLGRLGVDLRGPRAPHMLQAIAIGANFERSVDDMMLALSDRPNPAHEVVIGIYGEEEGRASGHNEGVPGRLPRRHFLGASDAEQQAMVEDINERIKSRIKLAETLKT